MKVYDENGNETLSPWNKSIFNVQRTLVYNTSKKITETRYIYTPMAQALLDNDAVTKDDLKTFNLYTIYYKLSYDNLTKLWYYGDDKEHQYNIVLKSNFIRCDEDIMCKICKLFYEEDGKLKKYDNVDTKFYKDIYFYRIVTPQNYDDENEQQYVISQLSNSQLLNVKTNKVIDSEIYDYQNHCENLLTPLFSDFIFNTNLSRQYILILNLTI